MNNNFKSQFEKDTYLSSGSGLSPSKRGRIAADGVSKATSAGSMDKPNQGSYFTILIVCKKPK